MPPTPDVSIVIPVHNDEKWIASALDSCLSQTLTSIEVVCVDDASTDGTPHVIERYAARDPRIRLIRLEANGSALQGRRAGVLAATAEHILFLDGDDQLAPDAARKALDKARSADADLVGFGVEVLNPDGKKVGGYQARLRPQHALLEADDVVTGLFPVGKPAQGQLWRYLFSTALLRQAYDLIPPDLVLRRVNDLPVMFLVAALARRYVSIGDNLYRYHFRRGGSGQQVDAVEQFEFYMGAIDSIDAIDGAVAVLAETASDRDRLLESYESARLSMVGNVLGYLCKNVTSALQGDCVALLEGRVAQRDIVTAALRFAKEAIEVLAEHGTRVELGSRPVRSVLLVTATLTTGGVSGVLLSQARFLLEAGYRVTIAARREGSDLTELPEGARFFQVEGADVPARVEAWAGLCEREEIDVVIDHQVLYIRDWPSYALMARALGIPTIGWIHNFSLRPVYDQKTLSSFLRTHLHALAQVVALSPLDVAFWKLRGVAHAAYLPNPPSPMLLASAVIDAPRNAPEGRAELIWVGRLDQHTKQVRALLDVAAELQRLTLDFRLRLVGPEWAGLTVEALSAEVQERGLAGAVEVVGPLRGSALMEAIDASDLFVTTSVIEGYQLTLAEAQARGVPVAMYELPWLTLVQDNDGLVAVPQGDAAGLAARIAQICADPERFTAMSAASISAAARARSYDFGALYRQLVTGALPAEFSPEPSLDDARRLLDWTIFFAERNAPAAAGRGGARARGRGVAPGGAKDGVAGRAARRLVRALPALEPFARKLRAAVRG